MLGTLLIVVACALKPIVLNPPVKIQKGNSPRVQMFTLALGFEAVGIVTSFAEAS